MNKIDRRVSLSIYRVNLCTLCCRIIFLCSNTVHWMVIVEISIKKKNTVLETDRRVERGSYWEK